MLKAHQLPLAILINAALLSSAYANEQSESKGFVDDATASVLLRNGFIQRDKKNTTTPDNNSWVQSIMFNAESGFTQGTVGFAAGVIGDFSFKLGENKHSGNNMVPHDNDGNPYDQWTRGGAYVKARASNTTVTYGTQVLDLPVLASNTGRMVPEYFTGTLIKSHEVENLELVAGKFTKDQMSDQIATDQNNLDRAYVWGGKYKFNDALNASYYGIDSKNALQRHYVNANYKQSLTDNSALTYDFSGYHTKFDKDAKTYSATGDVAANYGTTGVAGVEKTNNIWAFSTTYSHGPHSVMLAYQQNTGNVGYDYGQNADGFQSIYLPNSYLSDFNGNHEKSAQIQYNVDLAKYGVPGLSWTSAYVYGWDIKLLASDQKVKESEFFNQVKYTVQSGFAKDVSVRARYSIYRNDQAYANIYMPDTNETRIFIDIPVKFF